MEVNDLFSSATARMTAQPIQLTLFDDVLPNTPTLSERVSGVAWSYSKRSTFEQCPRRYYYHYYGASRRLAKQETKKQELQFIKQRVTTRFLLSGKVLHLIIKTYFNYAKRGTPLSVEDLVSFARRLYRESWYYSREHPNGNLIPDMRYPPSLLKEFYDHTKDADELCASEEDRLLEAVRAFATSSSFAEFRAYGIAASSFVEKSFRSSNLDCRVEGKIDLACRLGDAIRVIDWKIGESDDLGDKSLQLAVYGLLAVEHFNCTSKQLEIYKAFLSSGEAVCFRVSDSLLKKARVCILQDAERMAFMDQYGRDGVIEAFSSSPYQNVCQMCTYERICHE